MPALEQFSVAGKVALITGGARGLGADAAIALARAGARVVLSDLMVAEAEIVARSIVDAGGEAFALAHDVAVEDDWHRVILQVVERFGALDILVNNAGIERLGLFTEASVEDFHLMHEVNVTGVFLGMKHGARAMRPGGISGLGGSIINLSSVAGLIGVPGLGGYCSSKGAVRLMTKAAAVEFATLKYGIRVNSLHPAIIKTQLGANVVRGFTEIGLCADEEQAEIFVQGLHPLGYGQPRDVANAVLFLASDASQWMTGSELVLDGGASAC